MNKPQEMQTLDCRGMQCPAPILKVAQAARAAQGQPMLVEVVADDQDFASDIRAWVRATQAELLEIQEGEEIRVLIGLHGADRAAMPFEAKTAPPSLPEPSPPPQPAAAPSSPSSGAELDLRRLSPGAAILRLSQEIGARPGVELSVLAADQAFLGRLHVWASATDAVVGVPSFGAEGMRVSVTGPKGVDTGFSPPAPSPSRTQLAMPEPTTLAPPEPKRCSLLVLHNEFEGLMAAMMVANAAAAQGMDTQIFFSFWGVNLLRDVKPASGGPKPGFLQRMMKWMMPAGPARQPLGQMHFGGMGKGMMTHLMRRNNVLDLGQLMDAAEAQGVRFIGCTMSMGLMGISREDLMRRDNLEFGGVTSFVEASAGAEISMVF